MERKIKIQKERKKEKTAVKDRKELAGDDDKRETERTTGVREILVE